MSRDQRKAIIYSLIYAYGKEDIDLLIEVSGIPRSSFYKIMKEVETETVSETGDFRFNGTSSVYLRQIMRLDPPVSPEMRQDISVPERLSGDSGDMQTYITSLKNKLQGDTPPQSQKKFHELPVRARRYTKPNGQIVSLFARKWYEIKGKEVRFPRGDLRTAMRQAQSLVDRGYSLDECLATVLYFLSLGVTVTITEAESQWIDGHPWAKFISGFDGYYDRGVRTNKIVLPDPDVDHLILSWLDRVSAGEPVWDLTSAEKDWLKNRRSQNGGTAHKYRVTVLSERLTVMEKIRDGADEMYLNAPARRAIDAAKKLRGLLIE